MRLLLISLLLLLSCTPKKEEKLVRWQGIFFDIPFELQIAAPLSAKHKKEIQSAITDTFTLGDACFNHWNPESELGKINNSQETEYSISPPLRELIDTARVAYELTDGYYDPGLRDIIMQAKNALKAGILPPSPPSFHGGFSLIRLEEEKLLFTHKTSLDFDGLVKGHLVDLLTKKLHSLGHTQFLINWSGEVYASGRHPDGRKWCIFIPTLEKVIPLENSALATSGSEAQHWNIDGRSYTHIIHPKTLKPLEIQKPLSCSVEGPSCALADAIATAMLCHPSDNKQIDSYIIYK